MRSRRPMSDTPASDQEEYGRNAAAAEWLLRLKERDAPEETLAQWIEWWDSDPRNLRAFEEMRSLWRGAALHPPDAKQLTRLMRRDDRAPQTRRRVAPQRWLALATSLTALCAVGFLLSARLSTPSVDDGVRHAAPRDSVQTPLAANQQAVLPDGSRVDLGARSVLDV